jgi:hypothetical protein
LFWKYKSIQLISAHLHGKGLSFSAAGTSVRLGTAPGIGTEIPCSVRRRSIAAGIAVNSPPVAPQNLKYALSAIIGTFVSSIFSEGELS